MSTPKLLFVLSIAATVALAVPRLAQAQSQAELGSVAGTVFDSTMHAPLVDAAVFLWNTPFRTATDDSGRFVLNDVPPGDYSVLYFHTRLGEMGLSPGPTAVKVSAGEQTVVELATPSVFTVVTSECLFEAATVGTSVLAGFVADGDSGLGMPGAHVTLTWQDPEGALRHMELRTDARGWYRTCAAPADIPIVAGAEFLDRQGLRQELTLQEGGRAELGFLLFTMRTTDVSGRLLDSGTGEPVADAEIWIRGTAFRDVTDGQGGFQFPGVEPGEYLLMAKHLAYGTKMDTVEVPSGRTLSLEMRVTTEAIEIAPVAVSVEARTVTERAMGGIVVDRAAVDRVRTRARDAADVLRSQNIPGVIVRRRGDGTLCIGYMPGQVRMMWNTGCVPMVIFINNVRATNTDLALQLPPESIDRMVIYRPVEAGNLFGAGSANGVLAIFTRIR